jgi:hypothetical protein
VRGPQEGGQIGIRIPSTDHQPVSESLTKLAFCIPLRIS